MGRFGDGPNFQRPMAYNPALAERSVNVLRSGPPSQSRLSGPPSQEKIQRMASDLGFEEEAPAGNPMEERCKELAEQLRKLQEEKRELEESTTKIKESEAKANHKLQNIQQVSRSQTALMRAELGKCRRKLAHASAVAGKHKDQIRWFQEQSPALRLPSTLKDLPTEEDMAEEAGELAQLHERWEKDIAQLQQMLVSTPSRTTLTAPLPPAPVASDTPAVVSAGSGDLQQQLEAAQHRCAQFEAVAKKLKKQSDQQAKELEQLRQQLGDGGVAVAAATPVGEGDDMELRGELETSQQAARDHAKKLKQLAAAYKQLDQKKGELEAQLATSEAALASARAEAAKPREPERKPLSAALVQRVQAELAAQRRQVEELRAQVTAEMQQMPAALEQVTTAQLPLIQTVVEAGVKEWRDKWAAECDKRRKLHNLVQELKGNIRVYCRVRPLNERENASCISFPAPSEIQIRNDSMGVKKTWTFNQVFDTNSTQEAVFDEVRELVCSMMDGFNVCMFAYGQTGAGKTHSMQGTRDNPGIYQRTFAELFKVASERRGWKVELKGSIFEVYLEEIRDLLTDGKKQGKLQIKQCKGGGVEVPGMTLRTVNCAEDVLQLLDECQRNRSVAATDMNAHSSRSHLLVQIHGVMTTSEGKELKSQITLVDLAGSERLKQSGATGDRQKEAVFINKSLAALGDVINARATKASHVPYRNSALTNVLQDSLGGDSKTLMLLAINPCEDYVEETMCSLKFGERVNNVELKK